MAGTISWITSFVPAVENPNVEIYDGDGEIVQSVPVPCKPPMNCAVVMNNVPAGEYTGGLAVGNDRYYYVEGQSIIAKANDLDHASTIEITEMDQEVNINIYVNLL